MRRQLPFRLVLKGTLLHLRFLDHICAILLTSFCFVMLLIYFWLILWIPFSARAQQDAAANMSRMLYMGGNAIMGYPQHGYLPSPIYIYIYIYISIYIIFSIYLYIFSFRLCLSSHVESLEFRNSINLDSCKCRQP